MRGYKCFMDTHLTFEELVAEARAKDPAQWDAQIAQVEAALTLRDQSRPVSIDSSPRPIA
jgi:hypothetical protein